MKIFEISDILTATLAPRLLKYFAIIIVSHTMRFIYYLNIKLAGTFI